MLDRVCHGRREQLIARTRSLPTAGPVHQGDDENEKTPSLTIPGDGERIHYGDGPFDSDSDRRTDRSD
jgi:hypothetical protein